MAVFIDFDFWHFSILQSDFIPPTTAAFSFPIRLSRRLEFPSSRIPLCLGCYVISSFCALIQPWYTTATLPPFQNGSSNSTRYFHGRIRRYMVRCSFRLQYPMLIMPFSAHFVWRNSISPTRISNLVLVDIRYQLFLSTNFIVSPRVNSTDFNRSASSATIISKRI